MRSCWCTDLRRRSPSRPSGSHLPCLWGRQYGSFGEILHPDPRHELRGDGDQYRIQILRKQNWGNVMISARRIIPPALQGVYDNWHFAPAVESCGLIFCSGIIGTSPDGEPPDGEGLDGAKATSAEPANELSELKAVRDPEAQFATAFDALRAILHAAGADLSDLVEITTYHVDMSSHMTTFMRVKDRYIQAPYPAWTAIGVAELIVPGGLLEIRAVAQNPQSRKAN